MFKNNTKKIGAILQARMGSTRLPGKVMMDLAGQPMVLRVVKRLKMAETLQKIILAIPDTKENDVLARLAKKNRLVCFRGSETDVLARYYKAAKRSKLTVIVRVTADCPCLDPKVLDEVVGRHLETKADFTANNLEQTFPMGFDLQVFNFGTLEKANREATTSFEREHVVPFMRQHPELFRIKSVEAEGFLKRPELMLTVDEKENFELAVKIYRHFKDQPFSAKDLIDFLDQNPSF